MPSLCDFASASLARKSHAIFAPEPDGDRPRRCRITVESTFADRIERQTFRLEHAASGWLVTEIETAREHVPKTRFGIAGDVPGARRAPRGRRLRRARRRRNRELVDMEINVPRLTEAACSDRTLSDRKELTMGHRLIAVVLSLLVIVGRFRLAGTDPGH